MAVLGDDVATIPAADMTFAAEPESHCLREVLVLGRILLAGKVRASHNTI